MFFGSKIVVVVVVVVVQVVKEINDSIKKAGQLFG